MNGRFEEIVQRRRRLILGRKAAALRQPYLPNEAALCVLVTSGEERERVIDNSILVQHVYDYYGCAYPSTDSGDGHRGARFVANRVRIGCGSQQISRAGLI
jgi:hypothetical protein